MDFSTRENVTKYKSNIAWNQPMESIVSSVSEDSLRFWESAIVLWSWTISTVMSWKMENAQAAIKISNLIEINIVLGISMFRIVFSVIDLIFLTGSASIRIYIALLLILKPINVEHALKDMNWLTANVIKLINVVDLETINYALNASQGFILTLKKVFVKFYKIRTVLTIIQSWIDANHALTSPNSPPLIVDNVFVPF